MSITCHWSIKWTHLYFDFLRICLTWVLSKYWRVVLHFIFHISSWYGSEQEPYIQLSFQFWALAFWNRDILESTTAQGWIAWTNQHMLQYAPIHQQNQFLFLFHLGVRQGSLLWTLFRWDLYFIGNVYSSMAFPVLNFSISFELKFAASDENPRQFLSMPEEALQMVLSQVTDQNLRHTLQFGIGLHHAGLNDKDRSLVEELFANNKIQAVLHHLTGRSYWAKMLILT